MLRATIPCTPRGSLITFPSHYGGGARQKRQATYVHAYQKAYTHTRAHIHTHTCTYIHTLKCTLAADCPTHTHTYEHVQHTYRHTQTHRYTHMVTNTHMYVCVRTYNTCTSRHTNTKVQDVPLTELYSQSPSDYPAASPSHPEDQPRQCSLHGSYKQKQTNKQHSK